MSYGIAITQVGGPFDGMTLAVMQHYGIPALFDSAVEAGDYGRRVYGLKYRPRTIPASMALRYIRQVVEYFSGRLRIENGPTGSTFVLADATKPTFEQLQPWLKPPPPPKTGSYSFSIKRRKT